MASPSFIQVRILANRAPGYNRHVPQTATKITQNGPATLAMGIWILARKGKSWKAEGTHNNFLETCKENGKNLGGMEQFLTKGKPLKFSSLGARIFAIFLARIKIKPYICTINNKGSKGWVFNHPIFPTLTSHNY